jgi:hypothetical protein
VRPAAGAWSESARVPVQVRPCPRHGKWVYIECARLSVNPIRVMRSHFNAWESASKSGTGRKTQSFEVSTSLGLARHPYPFGVRTEANR